MPVSSKMGQFLEQKLTDEVIYLHPLLPHRRSPTNPTHNPSTTHLQPSKSKPTKFKKQKRRPKPKDKKVKKVPAQSDPPQVSDVEWPCPSFADSPSSAFEWPVLKLPPAPASRLPTEEEKTRFAATQLQQKALEAAQEFFIDSDSDEDCGGSGEDDFMDEDEYEEYKFFVKVFAEDGELRDYYEKHCESGGFSCLVCCGIGKKVGKRFKDCVALVQHSNGIAKTKKKRAHRAYAEVVCKVLGWDINRLPTSGLSLARSDKCQEVSNVDQGEELQNSNVPGLPAMSIGFGINVMLTESHLKADDADICMENLNSEYLDTADGETEGVVNCLCRNLSRSVVLETT